MTTRARHHSRLLPRWLLFLIALIGALSVTSPAAAHLGLQSTDPAPNAQLSQSPRQITLTFTKAARLAPGGLRLVNAAGQPVDTTTANRGDGVVWLLRPTTPLSPGRYGLAWKVIADDAHTRSGRLSFTVVAATGTQPETAVTPAPTATTQTPAMDGDHAGMEGMTHQAGGEVTAGADHSQADAEEEAPRWGSLAGAGRWLSIAGVLIAVGALIVVITTLVGSDGDITLSQRLIRTAALAAATGAVIEGSFLILTLGGAVPAMAAAAVLARLLGGAALAATLDLRARPAGGRRSHDVQVLASQPTRGGHGTTLLLTPPVRIGRVRPALTRPAAVVVASVVMIGSFCLDGHTASVGPAAVMIAADVLHTTGAAVWSGGVVLLATLLLVRARAGVPTGAGELAVRFSVPASAAAAAVAGAGAVLLTLILDEPAQLLTTPWGRLMAAKLVLVSVVALLGYANNRYAVPALDAWQPHTARMLRRAVAVEGTVMIVVLAVTAALVASGM